MDPETCRKQLWRMHKQCCVLEERLYDLEVQNQHRLEVVVNEHAYLLQARIEMQRDERLLRHLVTQILLSTL